MERSMKFRILTHENFLLYAIKKYENPTCTSADEFKRDMKHFAYISKFLNRPKDSSAPKYRLLLNHIITLRNLFGGVPTTRMMFFYFPEKHYPTIKTAVEYLQMVPEKTDIPEADISSLLLDESFSEFLRKV